MAPDRRDGLAQLGGERLGVGGRVPRAARRSAAGAGRRARGGRRAGLVHRAPVYGPRAAGPGYASADASQRSAARRAPAARRRHGQGRGPRGRDRRVRDPGVHRQPDRRGAAGRPAPTSCRRSATRLADAGHRADRHPRAVPHEPRRPGAGVPRAVGRACSPTSCGSAAAYGASFVNVHIGSHRGEGVEAGLARLTAGIVAALAPAPDDGPRTTPRRHRDRPGERLGRRVRHGHDDRGARRDRPRGRAPRACRRRASAFCLDTAHLWGAGYPIDTAAGVDEVLAAFDEQIGLDRLVMVHLNDSRSERGSRADRHEHVGAGPDRRRGPRADAHPPAARRTSRTSSRRRAWTRATTR